MKLREIKKMVPKKAPNIFELICFLTFKSKIIKKIPQHFRNKLMKMHFKVVPKFSIKIQSLNFQRKKNLKKKSFYLLSHFKKFSKVFKFSAITKHTFHQSFLHSFLFNSKIKFFKKNSHPNNASYHFICIANFNSLRNIHALKRKLPAQNIP